MMIHDQYFTHYKVVTAGGNLFARTNGEGVLSACNNRL